MTAPVDIALTARPSEVRPVSSMLRVLDTAGGTGAEPRLEPVTVPLLVEWHTFWVVRDARKGNPQDRLRNGFPPGTHHMADTDDYLEQLLPAEDEPPAPR